MYVVPGADNSDSAETLVALCDCLGRGLSLTGFAQWDQWHCQSGTCMSGGDQYPLTPKDSEGTYGESVPLPHQSLSSALTVPG